MADFDVIVVGAGYAGTVAAYELAKEGKSVLLLERGEYAGAKNMTGGRIYAHSLRKVFPEKFNEIPFERKITHERISLLTTDAATTVDFSSADMNEEDKDSYSVLSAKMNRWMCDQAEEAGAIVACGITVDSLLKDEAGKIAGIRAGEDEMSSELVILCDGVNSLLTKEAVGAKTVPASQLAVGVKQVFALPAETITNRILTSSDDEGAAWLFAGDATHGHFGGGFMYTNKESISLGIVVGIESLANDSTASSVCQMLDDLKKHPVVAPLIKDAKIIEHSGHMVPEGGLGIMPELVGDGVLVAGDAAMFCLNLGYMVRGMDYAVASGQIAAKAAIEALDAGDTSKAKLSAYVSMLESSFVLKDMQQFKNTPEFLENFSRMFNEYPELAKEAMNSMFIVDGSPKKGLKESMMPKIKKLGFLNLFKDVRGAMKSL